MIPKYELGDRKENGKGAKENNNNLEFTVIPLICGFTFQSFSYLRAKNMKWKIPEINNRQVLSGPGF